MGQARVSAKSKKKAPRKPRNAEAKTKAAAPGDWVTTLLHGKGEGNTILMEFRSGRAGPPMLVESYSCEAIEGLAPHASVIPQACALWDDAKIHRAGLEGDRYDYRIQVLAHTPDGEFHALHESSWIELPSGDGEFSMPEGMGQTPTEAMLAGMVIKLFNTNIGMTRAGAALLREYTAGSREGIDHEMGMVEKVKAMAMEVIERERQFAKEEADAQEVKEFGMTARQWLQQGHENRLADKGIKTPDVPNTRQSAAKSLWKSLTVGQLDFIKEELGDEKAELLLGLVRNCGDLDEAQIEQLLKENIGQDMESQAEMMSLLENVFSAKFVPAPWAIWQGRTANVLMHGPTPEDEKKNSSSSSSSSSGASSSSA